MNQPSPAIVTEEAARRLPRWALLLLCAAYVLAGYIGREPWKNADIASFGIMWELAHPAAGSAASWLQPELAGNVPEQAALLPYWLGAWAMQVAPALVSPDFAARLPFMLMLCMTLVATWYAIYHLARHEGAQPVAFAFGGEAKPADYARALADGGLLALIATLGLAQPSHETTPALAQLCFASVVFYGLSALPNRDAAPFVALGVGLPGLALSGAPSTAVIFGLVSGLGLLDPALQHYATNRRYQASAWLLALTGLTALLAWKLGLFAWLVDAPRDSFVDWRNLGRLFLWFTWPVWPLVLWTLWRWRHHLGDIRQHRHLGLPLFLAAVPIATTLLTRMTDRALLLALPALAALAALALPTLRRSMAALIDWFTVLFFSIWAIVIWVVWLSLQTGVPAKPAANVGRLAPGFEPVFQPVALAAALAGTLAWIWLARWRTGRHRTALWKSLVLPASGAALCWLLLMTLWLPALDYARSFAPQMRQMRQIVGDPVCVATHGLSTPQLAAMRFHGGWTLKPDEMAPTCPWLVVDIDALPELSDDLAAAGWTLVQRLPRPTDNNETLLIYRPGR